MSQVTLKYGTEEMTFVALVCDVEYPTNRKNGRLLNNGIGYSHLLAAWREWDVVISADELADPDKEDFVIAFWRSGLPRYFKEGSGEFIEVMTEGGTPAREKIEGSKYLPEYKLRLAEKNGAVG